MIGYRPMVEHLRLILMEVDYELIMNSRHNQSDIDHII